ncbi:hypothetical protein BANRA_03416 [Escherichia coli]|nr:hypothetical protein BANRA_03416 [Escherichia coli]
MDEVKKIEHGKILNTDTPDNSASNLDSFLKKNKNKEMSEIVAGTILQLLRQTQDSQFSTLGKKNGQMKSIDNKSSLVDRNSSLSLQTMEQNNFLQRKFSI